jgi:hypothetical protein
VSRTEKLKKGRRGLYHRVSNFDFFFLKIIIFYGVFELFLYANIKNKFKKKYFKIRLAATKQIP